MTLEERRIATDRSGFKHILRLESGTPIGLMQGENWFNMLYGVFHEREEEIRSTSGHTQVCFNVDGPHCSVKNFSSTNRVGLAKDSDSSFEPLPRLQMRILQPDERIHIAFPNDMMIVQEITVEYQKEQVEAAGNAAEED